jgi:hypothetical protein
MRKKLALILIAVAPISQAAEKACYVWFETNSQSYFDEYIDYGAKWTRIGYPVITGRMASISAFTDSLNDKGLSAIVGFKLSDFFSGDDYADANKWGQIASLARELADKTDGRPIILENEGATSNIVNSGEVVDLIELKTSISQQEWPIVWMWPSIPDTTSNKHGVLNTVNMAIVEAGGRLIEHYSAGYSTSPGYAPSQAALAQTLAVDANPISIVYLDESITNHWRFKDTEKAAYTSNGVDVIFYPGYGDLKNNVITNAWAERIGCSIHR